METQKIMGADNNAKSIRSKAAAELLKRQESIKDFAEKYGEEGAASLLALSADLDSNGSTELHAFLDERPHLKGMPYLAKDTLRNLASKVGHGSGSSILIGHEYKAMIKNLTVESDGPLEQLLVTRVVMCWLRLMYAENYKTDLMRASTTWKHIESADKDLSHAHTRYVRSVESLARVRKMVKIAEMADTQSRLMKERLTDRSKPAKSRLTLAEAKGA
jgi:hypothetical protein